MAKQQKHDPNAAQRVAAYRERQLKEMNMARLNMFVRARDKSRFMKLPGKNNAERLKYLLDKAKK